MSRSPAFEWSYGSDEDPFDVLLEKAASKAEGLKGNARAARENLEFYSRWVMGYGDPSYAENAHLHKQIYEALQYSNDDLVIIAPRNSAKSQCVVTWVTWAIGNDPLLRFLIAFASMEAQGLPFARQIDTILTKNERYIEIFGELKPRDPKIKWDASEKIVNRKEPPGGLKDATLTIVGLGSAVPSKRADRVIGDDLVTFDNAYSAVQQDRVESFWETVLKPTLEPTGRSILVGTLWSSIDLYHRVLAKANIELPGPLNVDPDKLKEQLELLELAS